MKQLSILLFLIIFTVPAVFSNAQNRSSEEIKEFMKERDREIKALVGPKGTNHTDEQKENLKDIINEVMDYGAMARYALQDTYYELSEEQRAEFVNVFSTIVRDQSLNSLDIYRADVEYRDISVEGNAAKVETVAILDHVRTPVIYELMNRGDSWVITDMSIDNVSTAESYRRSFQNIIRRRGYDALIASLKRRAEA